MAQVETLDQPYFSPSPSFANEPRPLLSSTPLPTQAPSPRVSQLYGEDHTDGQLVSFTTPSYSSGLHPVLSSKGYSQVHTHRQKLVQEIFDTEHSYISQLTTVVTLFLKPIRVGCLLPPDTITSIFSNIEAILSVNQELFSCMRKRSLGEAFSYLGPFLKLYSTYAENYQTANEILQDCLKGDSDFSSFVFSQESRPECCGLKLASLLITPVQRVPRYKLLLDDLLKHTKVTHTDYAKLKGASAEIASVSSHINEHVRQHENFKKMLSIQRSLTGQSVPSILSPGRRFLYEGRLMKVCRTSNYKKSKERMVFLFSDILIYAKPTKKDVLRCYECRCVLPLIQSAVKLVEEDERAPGIKNLFEVSNADTSLLFHSQQPKEVSRWAEVIKNAIRDLQQTYSPLVTTQSVVSTSNQQVTADPGTSVGGSDDLHSLNTLTKDSPYPLTATLFSPRSSVAPSTQDTHTGSIFKYDQGSLSQPQETIEAGQQSNVDDHQGNTSQVPDNECGESSDDCEASRLVKEGDDAGGHNHLNTIGSLSTIYSMENDYLGSKCCVVL